ncbi:MAG: Snf7 family protein [Candidatus Bathyarchaeia archaeon]
MKFVKDWDIVKKESILDKIGERIHNRPPLKERLSNSIYRIKVIQSKLEQFSNRLESKNRELFEHCTTAISEADEGRAAIYANECAEVRKIAKVVLRSQLALEQVGLRLETIREFGDVAAEMSPLTHVIQSLKGHLAGIIPEVSYELGVIGDTLNGLVVEAGEATGSGFDFEASSSEAQKILHDANVVAEQRMKDHFPALPVPGGATSESTPESR